VIDSALVRAADDFPDHREMCAEYLRLAGFRVEAATNGQRRLPEELVRHLRELLEAPSAKARSKPGRR
jgi:CheY-like chemotaxis protein